MPNEDPKKKYLGVEDFFAKQEGILHKLSVQKRNRLIGEVTSLLLSSNLHRKYQINDIFSGFVVPIHLNQFRIYKNKENQPIALITWAYFSKEVEKEYQTGKYFLKLEDWKSGNRLWAIDLIAPFGHVKEVSKDLKNNLFSNEKVRFLRLSKEGKIKGTHSYCGPEYFRNKKEKISNKNKIKRKNE